MSSSDSQCTFCQHPQRKETNSGAGSSLAKTSSLSGGGHSISSSWRAHGPYPFCTFTVLPRHVILLDICILDSFEDEENSSSIRFASRESQNEAVVSCHLLRGPEQSWSQGLAWRGRGPCGLNSEMWPISEVRGPGSPGLIAGGFFCRYASPLNE